MYHYSNIISCECKICEECKKYIEKESEKCGTTCNTVCFCGKI